MSLVAASMRFTSLPPGHHPLRSPGLDGILLLVPFPLRQVLLIEVSVASNAAYSVGPPGGL